ncbi:MAG: hypothetical protein HY868_00735 [Chloroflexi bacterium]|nr:hypothetical protein [Chloroflexota bacterium]
MLKQHRFASHSPDERRRLSDFGHIVEGALLGAVAMLALLNALGIAAWAWLAWSLLLLSSGVVLLFLLYARHPLPDWSAIWSDMQQHQHTQMAAASVLAGAAELVRAGTPNVILGIVFPAMLVFIGMSFVIHEQHGTGKAVAQAVVRHRILGATLAIAGLMRVTEIFLGQPSLAFAWSIVLLAAAVQLLLYREPAGAYEMHRGHRAQH